MRDLHKLVLTLPDGHQQEFELEKTQVTLGSAPTADITLLDVGVSKLHARIEHDRSGVTVRDLGSAGGTFVNGAQIERTTVGPGDVIKVGSSSLRLEQCSQGAENEAQTVIETAPPDETGLVNLIGANLSTVITDTTKDRLVVFSAEGTRELSLAPDLDRLTIGRASDNDLVLSLPGISRYHACIERQGPDLVVRDLDSRNGTWIGRQRVERRALVDGDAIRIRQAQIVFKRGFETKQLFDEEGLAAFAAPQPRRHGERRPVVLLPAMCGSELWRGSERVWPDVLQLLRNPAVLRLADDNPLEARAVLKDFCVVPNLIKLEQYGRLRDFLEESLGYERGRDLLEFPYDWRQDVRVTARRLASTLESWPVFAKPPVVIIAHSLGCLVARYYVEHLGGKSKVSRQLLMGGPHHGVPLVVSLVHSGRTVLPFGFRGDALRDVMSSFPAMYQVLPTWACGVDQDGKRFNVMADDGWLPEAQRPLLADARAFRQELAKTSSVPTLSIFGYGLDTVTGLSVQRTPEGAWPKAALVQEPAGDHTTPEYSAVFDPEQIHPVRQYHGSLYIDPDVQKRLQVELVK